WTGSERLSTNVESVARSRRRRVTDRPGGRLLDLAFFLWFLGRLLNRRLPRGRDLLEQPPGLADRVHRPPDDVHGHPPRAQRILQRLRHALERRRARRSLGVAGLEELHVVEHLVRLVVGERVELTNQAVAQDLIHGRVSRLIMSSTGLPRNRVRPVRTRAVTWMAASGVRLSSGARLASGTTTYTKPRSGSGPRASRYVAPFGMSGRSSSAFCTAMNWSVQRSTCPT